MNKIKGFVRKFAALVLAVVSIFSFSVAPTYAAELSQSSKATETVSSDAILRRSNRLVGYEQAEINSDGIITVHLDSAIWGGYIELTASGGTGRIVNVSVRFPNGSNQLLGACASDGSASTGLDYYPYLPKGDYTFYMDGSDHYYALACIYDK